MPIVRDPINLQRPISSMGIDPSSERGARLLAIRIKRYWLVRNVDVPVVVEKKVPIDHFKGKKRTISNVVWGATARWREAIKVNDDVKRVLLSALDDEMEALL